MVAIIRGYFVRVSDESMHCAQGREEPSYKTRPGQARRVLLIQSARAVCQIHSNESMSLISGYWSVSNTASGHVRVLREPVTSSFSVVLITWRLCLLNTESEVRVR